MNDHYDMADVHLGHGRPFIRLLLEGTRKDRSTKSTQVHTARLQIQFLRPFRYTVSRVFDSVVLAYNVIKDAVLIQINVFKKNSPFSTICILRQVILNILVRFIVFLFVI